MRKEHISLTIFKENAFVYCWVCAKGTVVFLLLLVFPLSQFLQTVSFCFIRCNKGLQRIQLKKQSFISYIKIYIWLHHKQTITVLFHIFFMFKIFLHKTTVKSTKEACWVLRMSKWEGEWQFFFFLSFFENLFYKKCAGYHGGTAVVRTQRLPMRITTYSNPTANKTLQNCTRGQ